MAISQAKQSSNADDHQIECSGADDVPRSSTRTLERGLQILDCFDLDRPEWTLSDICRHTGLAKATTFRLLKTLENHRYVTFDPASNRYFLGASMVRATYLMLSHSELVRVARPLLETLAEATTETVVLAVWLDQQSLVLDVVLTARPFKPHVRVGHVFRAPANAHTQVALAFLPSAELQAFVSRANEVAEDGGKIDPQRLEERLADIRIRGLAYDLEEQTLGISAAASPIYDASGQVRASVGVIAPAERFTAADIIEYDVPLKRAARELSRELGFRENAVGHPSKP